jgi:hypothetical protein
MLRRFFPVVKRQMVEMSDRRKWNYLGGREVLRPSFLGKKRKTAKKQHIGLNAFSAFSMLVQEIFAKY